MSVRDMHGANTNVGNYPDLDVPAQLNVCAQYTSQTAALCKSSLCEEETG